MSLIGECFKLTDYSEGAHVLVFWVRPGLKKCKSRRTRVPRVIPSVTDQWLHPLS